VAQEAAKIFAGSLGEACPWARAGLEGVGCWEGRWARRLRAIVPASTEEPRVREIFKLKEAIF
jgi:hypothetical protein